LAVRADPQAQASAHELLGNAIKFNPNGGRIEVAARLVEDRVRVEVGITVRVFLRKNKSASSKPSSPSRIRQETEGTGLAWLSPSLGRLHGGE